MNTFQVTRIVFLLLLIFVAGVWTGRLTAPQAKPVIVESRGGTMTAELALNRLKRDMSLTPEQELKMRKVFEEMEAEVVKFPALSKERLDVLRRYEPRMKAAVDPNQHEALDRYIREVERKVEAIRKRRGG